MSVSQHELEQILLNRDKEKFAEALVNRYFDEILRLGFLILGDMQDAQDAAQETFVDALLHIERFQPGTNLRAWLAKIALHKSQAILRKRKARNRLEIVLKSIHLQIGRTPTTLDSVLHNEIKTSLWTAINKLDVKHKVPIILYYVNDYSIDEIAEILSLKKGTVNSRLHYALRKLRNTILFLEIYPYKTSPQKSKEIDQ